MTTLLLPDCRIIKSELDYAQKKINWEFVDDYSILVKVQLKQGLKLRRTKNPAIQIQQLLAHDLIQDNTQNMSMLCFYLE